MVGDKAADVLFGRNIGATSVLVLTGYGRAAAARLETLGLRPAHTAAGVLEAADWIVSRGGASSHGPL
jgi:phosphoglycolate phosphatase-like HAD superfamily hydrolase